MKLRQILFPLMLLPLLMTGCSTISDKNTSIWVIYGAAAVLSLLILSGYCIFAKKRNPWLLMLFGSVLVVNLGYLALSLSHTLQGALLANRISYLGSVFLPLSMLQITLNVTKLGCKRWVHGCLFALAAVVFLVAASPNYLDIYYKDVSITTVAGATVLEKVYGSWHCLYLFYLLGYFAATVWAVIRSAVKKTVDTTGQAVVLAIAVFANLAVWLVEQLIHLDFEILSLSYIITELFLLGLDWAIWESANRSVPPAAASQAAVRPQELPLEADATEMEMFLSGYRSLTPTERVIFHLYVDGKTTKEIMEQLTIKENTLKFHNKNLYSKLGVSSRKQLLQYAALMKQETS